MRAQFVIPVIASILILGTLGLSYDAFAGDDNNGNNGCEKSGNDKACAKNPNSSVTCLDCLTQHAEAIAACTDSQCQTDALFAYQACSQGVRDKGDNCSPVPPGGI